MNYETIIICNVVVSGLLLPDSVNSEKKFLKVIWGKYS
jgi:hypothetical protein